MLQKDWNVESIHDYWKVTASGKHVVQIYDSREMLIDSLEGFARSGLNAGESVIIIARAEVHSELRERLETLGFNTSQLRAESTLILLNAYDVLASFMVDGLPDPELFKAKIQTVFKRATGSDNRGVRAYGEMVTLLWQDNNRPATLALERLWNDFCAENPLTLFCAYPSHIFSNPTEQIQTICFCHDHLLNGKQSQKFNVYYSES